MARNSTEDVLSAAMEAISHKLKDRRLEYDNPKYVALFEANKSLTEALELVRLNG